MYIDVCHVEYFHMMLIFSRTISKSRARFYLSSHYICVYGSLLVDSYRVILGNLKTFVGTFTFVNNFVKNLQLQ